MKTIKRPLKTHFTGSVDYFVLPGTVLIFCIRIYKTFLARGSPLELNVTTQDQVREDIRSLQWAIVDRIDAVTILEETETQVLDMLVLHSFLIQLIIK